MDAGVVARMAAALVHRGPDGQGTFVGEGWVWGSGVLAILDLETGDQPIANEDGSVVVVRNGEIYNHVELRAELERAGHRFRTRSAGREVEPSRTSPTGEAYLSIRKGELAARLGVSRQTINAIENGRYDPSLPLAFDLARVFRRTIEELFEPDRPTAGVSEGRGVD